MGRYIADAHFVISLTPLLRKSLKRLTFLALSTGVTRARVFLTLLNIFNVAGWKKLSTRPPEGGLTETPAGTSCPARVPRRRLLAAPRQGLHPQTPGGKFPPAAVAAAPTLYAKHPRRHNHILQVGWVGTPPTRASMACSRPLCAVFKGHARPHSSKAACLGPSRLKKRIATYTKSRSAANTDLNLPLLAVAPQVVAGQANVLPAQKREISQQVFVRSLTMVGRSTLCRRTLRRLAYCQAAVLSEAMTAAIWLRSRPNGLPDLRGSKPQWTKPA